MTGVAGVRREQSTSLGIPTPLDIYNFLLRYRRKDADAGAGAVADEPSSPLLPVVGAHTCLAGLGLGLPYL